MGKYYNPQELKFSNDFMYKPLWDLAREVIKVNEEGVNTSLAQLKMFDNLDIPALQGTPDEENAKKEIQKYSDKANEIATNIQNTIRLDPKGWRNHTQDMTSLAEDLNRNMKKGNISKFLQSSQNLQKWLETNKEIKKTDPVLYNLALNHYMNKWKEENPKGSLDNVFNPQDIIQMDINEAKYKEGLDKFKADSYDVLKGDYIINNERVKEEDVEAAYFNRIMADPKAKAYLQQMIMFKAPGFYDAEKNKPIEIFLYTGTDGKEVEPEKFQEEVDLYNSLPEKKRVLIPKPSRFFNPNFAWTPAIKSQGEIHGYNSNKISVNSAALRRAEMAASRNQFIAEMRTKGFDEYGNPLDFKDNPFTNIDYEGLTSKEAEILRKSMQSLRNPETKKGKEAGDKAAEEKANATGGKNTAQNMSRSFPISYGMGLFRHFMGKSGDLYENDDAALKKATAERADAIFENATNNYDGDKSLNQIKLDAFNNVKKNFKKGDFGKFIDAHNGYLTINHKTSEKIAKKMTYETLKESDKMTELSIGIYAKHEKLIKRFFPKITFEDIKKQVDEFVNKVSSEKVIEQTMPKITLLNEIKKDIYKAFEKEQKANQAYVEYLGKNYDEYSTRSYDAQRYSFTPSGSAAASSIVNDGRFNNDFRVMEKGKDGLYKIIDDDVDKITITDIAPNNATENVMLVGTDKGGKKQYFIQPINDDLFSSVIYDVSNYSENFRNDVITDLTNMNLRNMQRTIVNNVDLNSKRRATKKFFKGREEEEYAVSNVAYPYTKRNGETEMIDISVYYKPGDDKNFLYQVSGFEEVPQGIKEDLFRNKIKENVYGEQIVYGELFSLYKDIQTILNLQDDVRKK